MLGEVGCGAGEPKAVPDVAAVLAVAREIGRDSVLETLIVVQVYIPPAVAVAVAVVAMVVVFGTRGDAAVVAAVVIDTSHAPVLSRRCAGRMTIAMLAEVDALPIRH